MKIQKATEEDIPDISNLVHTCYRGQESFKGWTSEANMLDGNRTTPERLQREMSAPDISVLKCTDESGQLIACALMHKQGDRMHTGMLCVRPTLQGAGLGKTMMRAVENLARKAQCTKVKIEVITARTELVQWYERQGFIRNGKSTPFPPPTVEFGIPKVDLHLMEMEKPL